MRFKAVFAGTRSISTSVSEVGAIVTNVKTAQIVPPRSVPDIERSIAVLVYDRKIREKLSKNGCLLIEKSFTLQLTSLAVKALYEERLGASTPSIACAEAP